jgi:hypothetical protein
MKRIPFFAASVFSLILSADVKAGGPPPVCMVVDKVVLEPDDAAPTRIQIHGTFILLDQTNESYGAPRRGYLYYAAQQGKEADCRKEWADLRRLVSDKQIVAFGICCRPKIDDQLRSPGEKVTSPDTYPPGQGGFTPATRHVSAETLKALRDHGKRVGGP